jgi:putative PIN family toxin of toxin-antitoxin system
VTVVVADTGIYVSALVFGGVPQTALIQIFDRPFSLAVSEEIKAELTETLTRKFGWPDARVAEACRHLWANALWCKPVAVQASRDPDDDHVLGCALAASARVIVTGDKDLLSLHPFQDIAIVTPAAFLTMAWEDRNDD